LECDMVTGEITVRWTQFISILIYSILI
jgi:hypothetical protein